MLYVRQGQTTPDDWVDYVTIPKNDASGAQVEVDTSAADFNGTPHYLVTLEFDAANRTGGTYRAMGINAIYDPTPQSFRITVSWADLDRDGEDNRKMYPMPLDADFAKRAGWYIRWTGIELRP